MANTRTPTRRQQAPANPNTPATTDADPEANRAMLQRVEARERHPMVVAIEERMPQIQQMLPPGVDPDRYKALVLRTLVANPDLLTAEPTSVLVAISQAAQEGIEPTGQAGGGYLVVFRENDVPKAQLIRDYRHVARSIVESGVATRVDANVVRPGDEFAFQLGSDPWIRHVPNLDSMDEAPTHYYALAWMADGTVKFEVMTHAMVEHVGKKSRAWSRGPWQTDFPQMGRKTVIKRLANYLPLRPGARAQIFAEDEIEYGTVSVEALPPAQLETAERSAERRERVATRRRAPAAAPETPPETPDPPAEPARRAETAQTAVETPDATDAPSDPAEAPAAPARAPRRAGCTHPADRRIHRPDVGVVCGMPDCGEVLAEYAPEDAPTPARPRGQQRETPAVAENVLMRRLHAQAAARKLSHDDLKVIAAAVAGLDADETAEYSMADLVDDVLTQTVEILDSLPTPVDVDNVSTWVYPKAQANGINAADPNENWKAIDVLAAAWSGKSPDEITPAEWIAFAVRLEAGEFDAQQQQ